MIPISIQLYTVREYAEKDFRGVLKTLADIGYTGVETAGLHGFPTTEVKNWLDEYGLVCSSAHSGIEFTSDAVDEIVATAKTLGYNYLIGGVGEWGTVANVDKNVATCRASAALVKPFGMKVGVHNHWLELDVLENGKIGLDYFLEQNPDAFSELDIYWACNFGLVDVPAFIARNKKDLDLLHIKDGTLERNIPHTAVGKGKVPIVDCLKAADPNVTKWAVVELDECATDMWQAVKDSYDFLTGTGLVSGNK